MKTIQIINFDGLASGLQYQEVPIPEPRPGQIAVDMDHVGVGYVEALFTEGLMAIDLSWIPGLEVSGRVHTLGDGADGYRAGNVAAALATAGGGGYEQVVVAPTELTMPLSTDLNSVLAAVASANSIAALAALEEIADLHRGESVLVHAATDDLGSQMGQMARLLGVGRVVGVTRNEAKRQEILDLGCNEAWLTGDLAEADPAQFDAAADPATGPARLRSLDLLRTGGRFLVLGNVSQEQDQQVSTTSLWLRSIGVIGFSLGTFSQANPGLTGGHLRRVMEFMASGELRVHVTDRPPIQEVAQAVVAVRAGTTTGKIIPTRSQD